jgi:N-acetylglucosaminyldiphosphoundecaprenol N-acetyl-beta-D-mannosaminyltransferase
MPGTAQPAAFGAVEKPTLKDPSDLRRFNVLGVNVCALNIPLTLLVIDDWIRRRTPHYVTVTGVHGVMESQADEALRQIHNDAGMVTPDGMPMVWLGKLAGYKSMDRVYGPDLMLAVCRTSQETGYRHFLYGGADGVPELLKEKLAQRFPGLDIVGTYSPPFRPLTEQEDADVVRMINESNADIVWVGLSTPKQERWMAEFVKKVDAPVLIGVGAAFDFHAGLKKQAPRWIQRSGFEWLYRLASEPRRLWRRYLKNNLLFLYLIALQGMGLKRYGGDRSQVKK